MNPRSLLSILFLLTTASTFASAKGTVGLGGTFHSWDSNFTAHGSENLFPLTLSFKNDSGRFEASGGTGFAVGRYETDANGSEPSYGYHRDRFTDSFLRTTVKFPLGPMEALLSGRLDLPTGDEKWEAQQAPGNVPVLFLPTRYRGRGTGGQAIAMMAVGNGSWEGAAGGGFSSTGAYQPDPGSSSEWELGDAMLAVVSVAKRWGGRASATLMVLRTYPGDTQVAGVDAFRVPAVTRLMHSYRRAFGTESLGWDLGLSLYGKGLRAGPSGTLTEEAYASFGKRIDARPFLRFAVRDGLTLENALQWKTVLANGYPQADLLHEEGGTLFGVEQDMRVEMSEVLAMHYGWAYRYIVHEQAALDAAFRPADVTFNSYEFGTRVEYRW